MAQIINRVEGMLDEPPRQHAKVINRDAVLALPDMRAYAINGRFYITPPVGTRIGVRVEGLAERLEAFRTPETSLPVQITEAGRAEYWKIMGESRALFRGIFKPIGKRSWLRRQLWRVGLHDPTATWSEGQIGRVLGFLFGLRMKADVWSGQMENVPQ